MKNVKSPLVVLALLALSIGVTLFNIPIEKENGMQYGGLTGSAKGLLLALRDDATRKPKELREAAGIQSERNYRNARSELALGGYITVTTTSPGLPPIIDVTSIGMSERSERLTIEEEIKIVMDTLYETYPDNSNVINSLLFYYYKRGQTGLDASTTDDLGSTDVGSGKPLGSGEPRYVGSTEPRYPLIGSDLGSTEPTLLPTQALQNLGIPERCQIVDEMDDSGDHNSRLSPFQERRKQQIILLREAFSVFFPKGGELTDGMCKTWLSSVGNIAIDVYDKMEEVYVRFRDMGQELIGAKSYLSKCFSQGSKGNNGPKKFQGSDDSHSSTIPLIHPQENSDYRILDRVDKLGKREYNNGDELPEPSAELLREAEEAQARFEKMKQERGWQE